MRAIIPVRSVLKSRLFCAAFLAVLMVPDAASALQFGTYRCWSYNVSGGGGNCRLSPPIVLRADGTYQESSTSGTYRIEGNRIHFSKSTVRGAGEITGENRITFEYDYRDWHHTVTYLCQECSAGSGAAGPKIAAGASVWVAVRLNFDRADGYLGWANSAYLVPAAQAAQFAAAGTATPPPGSASGSAYADGKQTVVANFRKAAGGQEYVVFLDSGRQRVPVAAVHVPPAPAEQTLEVKASMNFSPAPAATDYPHIGVEVMNVTPEIAAAVGNPALKGAGVRRLVPGGPAEKAGVLEGDIITHVNGNAVTGTRELIQALGHRKSGVASHLSIYRGGRTIGIVVP